MIYVGAKDVKPLPEFRLLVTFDTGEKKIFNVTPYLDKGRFAELKEISRFNQVRIGFDTVEWPNGADLCPETLYLDGVPFADHG